MSEENTINVLSQTLEIKLDSGERLLAMLSLYCNYPITSENYFDVLEKFRDSIILLKNEIDKLVEKINSILEQVQQSSETSAESTTST